MQGDEKTDPEYYVARVKRQLVQYCKRRFERPGVIASRHRELISSHAFPNFHKKRENRIRNVDKVGRNVLEQAPVKPVWQNRCRMLKKHQCYQSLRHNASHSHVAESHMKYQSIMSISAAASQIRKGTIKPPTQ